MGFRFGTVLIVLGSLSASGPLAADPAAESVRRIRPADVNVARQVSSWVLRAQRQERDIAAATGLSELEDEIARLRRAVNNLIRTDRNARIESLLGRGATSSAVVAVAAGKQQVLARVDDLRDKRFALEDSRAAIRSPRQRRVADRAGRRFEQIEREIEESVHAPPEERLERLVVLERDLRLNRYGISSGPLMGDRNPTLRALPHPPPPRTRQQQE